MTIDLVKQVVDEIEKRGQEQNRLSSGVYGLGHELIGKSCFYNDRGTLRPAIPYGSYTLSDRDDIHLYGLKKGGQLLAILWYAENEPGEGINVKVKAMSGIMPEKLIPVDPSSKKSFEIYHTILSWLAGNRTGAFRAEEERKEVELTPA